MTPGKTVPGADARRTHPRPGSIGKRHTPEGARQYSKWAGSAGFAMARHATPRLHSGKKGTPA